jgi:hypothetical protein
VIFVFLFFLIWAARELHIEGQCAPLTTASAHVTNKETDKGRHWERHGTSHGTCHGARRSLPSLLREQACVESGRGVELLPDTRGSLVRLNFLLRNATMHHQVLLEVRGGPWALLESSFVGNHTQCARVLSRARLTIEHAVLGGESDVAPAQGGMHVTNRARVHAKHTTFQFVGVADTASLTQEEGGGAGGGGGGSRHAVRVSDQAVILMSLSLFQNCELGIGVEGSSDSSVSACLFKACHAAFDAQGEEGGAEGAGGAGGESVVDGEEEMVKEQGCGGGNSERAGGGWASSVRTARRKGEEGRGEEGRGARVRGCQLTVEWCLFTAGKLCSKMSAGRR